MVATRPKRGRPEKPAENRLSETISLSVTPKLYEAIRRVQQKETMSILQDAARRLVIEALIARGELPRERH